MNRELPVTGASRVGWVTRVAVVGAVSALVTTAVLWQWGAPPQGDHSPYPTVTVTVPGA